MTRQLQNHIMFMLIIFSTLHNPRFNWPPLKSDFWSVTQRLLVWIPEKESQKLNTVNNFQNNLILLNNFSK